MVQINKYNAINSIKTTASQNLKKLRGRANRGKEQDHNKRDVKGGGGVGHHLYSSGSMLSGRANPHT